jgi:ATP-dependent 26S proteasome regulatory subunit
MELLNQLDGFSSDARIKVSSALVREPCRGTV